MCRDFARREYSRWSRKIDPFISLSSFSLSSFSSSSVSREWENRSVSGPEARTLDFSFFFSPLSGGSERRISASRDRSRLRSSHLSPSSFSHVSVPSSHFYSHLSVALCFLPRLLLVHLRLSIDILFLQLFFYVFLSTCAM